MVFNRKNDNNTITNFGNDNGVANPDEMFDLTIALLNVGSNANTVTCVLTRTNGKSTVSNANGAWGTINTNAAVENTGNAFRVKLNSGFEAGEYVRFNLAVSSSNGNNNVEIALLINNVNIVQHFNLGDISGDLVDPLGLDVLYYPAFGWLMFASGTGFGNALGQTGANRLYMFNLATMGTDLLDFMGIVGTSYIVGLYHDNTNNYIWYANSDQCYCFDISAGLSGAVEIGHMTWHNTTWGGTPMKRVRGLTFNNVDSLYAYWQVYDTSFVESLFGETKNLGGTASEFAGWLLNDGESYGGHWNNGRGLEWDGTCFWTINIYIPTLYRRDPVTFEYFYKTLIPSVFDSYPSYDIAWSAEGPIGIDDITPFKPGNRYYMWTVNMDNADVYKLEVTSAVLPTAVELDIVASTASGSQTDLVWHPNITPEMVSHYIVYRSTNPNFYASNTNSIGITIDTTYTDYPPISKADIFYYSIRAVNYHGYSENTSFDVFESDFGTAMKTINMNAIQIDNNVVLSWRPENIEGIKWNILRKSKTDAEYKTIGSININKEFLVNEFKYVDESITDNGIYNYKLELVTSTGNKIQFNEISCKHFNELVFGIKPIGKNPVKGDIVLNYGIDRDGDILLNIYNITGALVNLLLQSFPIYSLNVFPKIPFLYYYSLQSLY